MERTAKNKHGKNVPSWHQWQFLDEWGYSNCLSETETTTTMTMTMTATQQLLQQRQFLVLS